MILSSADTAEAGKPTYDLGIADSAYVESNPAVLDAWARAQDYAVQQILEDPDKAAESVAVEVGVSVDEAKAQFAGLTYLRASEQAGEEWLGRKLGEDLLATAEFLLGQDGIESVAAPQAYSDGVNADVAASVKD